MELTVEGGRRILRLEEWERADLELPVLSDRDRVVAEALASGDGKLFVEELRDRTRVRATSWIGVVRFHGFEVRVEPKYVGGNLGVLEMLDYVSGFGSLARFPRVRDLAVGGKSLFDLIALLLADECRRLLREGLLQDYVTHEESLALVRGRLLPLEQVTRRFGRVDTLECRFDEYETDIQENRLLAAALEAAASRCEDDGVRGDVRRMRSVFQELCLATNLDWDWVIHPVEYHRRNEHYRVGHEYARLILRSLAVRDLYEASSTSSFTFLLDMNWLFEAFVTRLLSEALAETGIRVLPQHRQRSTIVDEMTEKGYRTVIPDMLLVRPADQARVGRLRVPVDTKYKLYQEGKIDPGDIYQLFFYGYAFDRSTAPDGPPARALLLYPSKDPWHQIRLRAQTADAAPTARLLGWGVDVPQALEAVAAGSSMDLPFVKGILAVTQ